MRRNSNKVLKKILYVILLLFLLLLISVYILYVFLQKEENNNADIEISTVNQPKTIEDIIKKYESIYIRQSGRHIYVSFKEDLYGKDGKSNQQYFEKLIDDLIKQEELLNTNFSLIDEEKSINIKVTYNYELDKHTIYYNDINNFYNVSNGDSYSKVDEVEIIKKVNLTPKANELTSLIKKNMFFRAIKDEIGEGIELDNGYTSFQDGKLLMRIYDNRVKNIIFTSKYAEDIFSNIKVGTDLEEIKNKYEEFAGGSVEKGYIMYRTKDIYAFFYEDEIVIYGYSYFENESFEDSLEQYLIDNNLNIFVENVTNSWINYDKCEYDFDIKYAHITYPSRGVEINITDNNTLGIKLYKNYYFTDRTKKWVKDGKISLNDTQDYLEITEIQRRKNFER